MVHLGLEIKIYGQPVATLHISVKNRVCKIRNDFLILYCLKILKYFRNLEKNLLIYIKIEVEWVWMTNRCKRIHKIFEF